jgi:3-oxoacyl-[acyl-carrier-protein] synthase-3
MHRVRITGTGLHLPEQVQTAAQLAPLIGRSERWILSRTGVAERRIATEPMDVMGAAAARQAIGDGPPPDCIINASVTPLQLIPDSSTYIQRQLGYEGIPCWTVAGNCLSFLIALANAAALVSTGVFRRILIVSSEAGSPWRYLREAESAALFGDGAAAVVVEPSGADEASAILDWEMGTWPEGADLTVFPGAGTRHPPGHPELTKPEDNFFHMKGPAVFRLARHKVTDVLGALWERNGITARDIDCLVLHQASGRAVAAAEAYGFDMNRVVNVVDRVGNTIAASTPIALVMGERQGMFKRGDTLLLGGTGAGLSVAFMLLRW